jgi:hypothetical protein
MTKSQRKIITQFLDAVADQPWEEKVALLAWLLTFLMVQDCEKPVAAARLFAKRFPDLVKECSRA